MAYLPELHYCCTCGVYLGPDNGDGICSECEMKCRICGNELKDDSDDICPACAEKEYDMTGYVNDAESK